MAHRFRFLTIAVMLVALAGCKLIDQTTFAPETESEPAVPTAVAPARPAGQVALVSIRFDTATPPFQDQLAFAVRTAEERRPGSQYDVVGVSTAAEAAQASRDSAAIMDAIVKLGVADTRVHLGARIIPAQTVREVRVYLR